MIPDTDKAYIAGLFDGEGSVFFKRATEKKKKHNGKGYRTSQSMRINMEITMTDESVIRWVHEVLGVGTVGEKRYKTSYTVGWKKQWRWRCQFRDAYLVSRLLWPYVHVKMDGIQKILDHYADKKIMNGNVVNLEKYKQLMALE